MFMTASELQQELADAEMVLQDTEDRRARAWADHDDEEEAMLASEITQLRGRIYEIEQLLSAR